MSQPAPFHGRGFTLIELLVVLAIVSVLLGIAAPRYLHQADRAREAALRENLSGLRTALDHYYSDKGNYPEKLSVLVEQRYLRAMPLDPITDSRDSWVPELLEVDGGKHVVRDVRSGAAGTGLDGTPFSAW